jgi:hypothetical protein
MDARDRLRSRVSFGLDPLACWSGIAGRTAGCCPHARRPRCLGPAARLRLLYGPVDRAGRSRYDLRLRAATFVCDAATSDTTLGAPTRGREWCRRSDDGAAGATTTGHAFASLRHHPRPSMRPGMVPHSGQASAVCGGSTPYTRTLSEALSGRRLALPTSQWSWAAAGLPSVCRIVGPYRHWRPLGRSVGRAEPALPLADRRQRRVFFGAGCRCTRPACAPSAGLTMGRIGRQN